MSCVTSFFTWNFAFCRDMKLNQRAKPGVFYRKEKPISQVLFSNRRTGEGIIKKQEVVLIKCSEKKIVILDNNTMFLT